MQVAVDYDIDRFGVEAVARDRPPGSGSAAGGSFIRSRARASILSPPPVSIRIGVLAGADQVAIERQRNAIEFVAVGFAAPQRSSGRRRRRRRRPTSKRPRGTSAISKSPRTVRDTSVQTAQPLHQFAAALEQLGGVFHQFAAALEHLAAGFHDVLAGLVHRIAALLGLVGEQLAGILAALRRVTASPRVAPMTAPVMNQAIRLDPVAASSIASSSSDMTMPPRERA